MTLALLGTSSRLRPGFVPTMIFISITRNSFVIASAFALHGITQQHVLPGCD